MRRAGMAFLPVFILSGSPGAGSAQQPPLPTVVLRSGMVITRSARGAPRGYRFPAPASPDSAVITVRGGPLNLDFAGATPEGADPNAAPDAAAGVAIRVEGGHGIKILHALIRGYKVGILARGTGGLTLTGNVLSYGGKPRLYSVVEHESLADWLSYHHNEKDDWLRFGAAIYPAGGEGGGRRRTQHQ